MKIKSLVVTATLALTSLGAFAGDSACSNSVVNFPSGSEFPKCDPFTQTINFYGLAEGLYDILGAGSETNLSVDTIMLDTNSWTLSKGTTPLKSSSYAFCHLELPNAKPITLALDGDSSANANCTSILTGTTDQRPKNYIMLLGGLGLMGAIARRRNKRTES